MAKDTVSQLLGQPIQYYVRINFEGFRKVLEEIGCIEVDVPNDISDPTFPDNNYGFDPFNITAGHYCMDADTALKYARTRHADSDFGRMERQQQVIMAMKNKVLDTGQLPHLISRLPALVTAFGESVQTDMPLGQMLSLANIARQLNADNIRRFVIDRSMVKSFVTDTGAQVLLPQMDVLQPAVDAFFNPDLPPLPPATPTPVVPPQLLAENARIVVLNGTSNPDMGKAVAEWLSSQSFNVVGYGEADRTDYAQTQLITYQSTPFTQAKLVELFAIGDEAIRPGASASSQADIQIIVGANFNLP